MMSRILLLTLFILQTSLFFQLKQILLLYFGKMPMGKKWLGRNDHVIFKGKTQMKCWASRLLMRHTQTTIESPIPYSIFKKLKMKRKYFFIYNTSHIG